MPAGKRLQDLAAAAFGSGLRAASAAYLVLAVTLGAYGVIGRGAGPGDLFPGFVFVCLTAPVSIPALEFLPAAWIDTRAFLIGLVVLAPVGTIALVVSLVSLRRRLAARLRRPS